MRKYLLKVYIVLITITFPSIIYASNEKLQYNLVSKSTRLHHDQGWIQEVFFPGGGGGGGGGSSKIVKQSPNY